MNMDPQAQFMHDIAQAYCNYLERRESTSDDVAFAASYLVSAAYAAMQKTHTKEDTLTALYSALDHLTESKNV